MANERSNLLLLSGGSKVAIARIALSSARKRGIELHVSDTKENVPSRQVADKFHLLPNHSNPKWLSALVDLCGKFKIGLIIPTRHAELLSLSKIKGELQTLGTQISISGQATIELCNNKVNTFHFLKEIDAPTPETTIVEDAKESFPFPAIAKPVLGAASKGITEADSYAALTSVPKNWLLQEKIYGQEYTINLYLNKSGEVRSTIPHRRIIVESGEVVQAQTERLEPLIRTAVSIAKKLPDAQGIINIQAFHDEKTGECKVIEINPRIGGGYPLCDAAKGHYIEWLCSELLDGEEIKPFENWTENLLMMRFRDAIFSL